jgi:glycosyltransferase involved in cell wall biosynthesis/GR25 family glycosyltransferase involved in LPS biosynthesis
MDIIFYTGYHHKPWNHEVTDIGGSETAVVNIAKHLSIIGHSVIVTGRDIIEGEDDLVKYIPSSILEKSMSNVDYLIGINYIHFVDALDYYVSAKHKIFWAHNTEHFEYSSNGNVDYDYSDSRITAIICVSEWHKDVYSRKYPSCANRIKVIENGIDLSLFSTNFTRTEDRFIYSSAPERGLEDLLKVWPTIKKHRSNAELILCAPSYSTSSYDSMSELLKQDGIIQLGSLPKESLYREITKSEFWVYPSFYKETFCITALEMMYGGCIPLCTDTSNLKTLVPYNELLTTTVNQEYDSFIEEFKKNTIAAMDSSISTKDSIREFYKNHSSKYAWEDKALEWDEFLKPKTVNNFIQKIYIISLTPDDESKKERWKEQLLLAGLSNIELEIFKAVNGNDISSEDLKDMGYTLYPNWKMDSSNGWWDRIMKPGEIGCALSHHMVWKLSSMLGLSSVLILEEDFTFENILTDSITKSVPCNWDMLYLGRNALLSDVRKIDDNIVVPSNSYNLHAYMLSGSGIRKLMEQNFHSMVMPVDEFIICTYATHQREDLKYIWDDSICYAVTKNIFKQNGAKSMTENIHIQDRLHPDLYSYYDDRDSWYAKFLSPGIISKQWDLLLDEPCPGVFCLQFFTTEFCSKIKEESEHANKWTTDRHEFYPTNDFLLNEIGFNDIFNELMKEFVMPLMIDTYALAGKGWEAMSCENFVARYVVEKQAQLNLHHDASDLTALVNLSQPDKCFEGGGTYFKMQKALYRPPMGSLSIHPGNITHLHGGRPVTKGKRYIMVSFMSNRNK